MIDALALAGGGIALGLASALHCSCMCGGIASGALFLLEPRGGRARIAQLLLLQTGRIALYVAAGAVVAGAAGLVVGPALTATGFRVLQWIAAAGLMWVGLAMAGMLPRFAPTGGRGLPISSYIYPLLGRLRARPVLGPLALGFGWGLTPCPMVYAALFTAGLSGSAGSGALWMLGFGLGTVPGVVASALGVSMLSRVRRGPIAEVAAGLAIAAFGFATLYFGWPLSTLFCAPT